jgi:hypothetical protein
MEVIRTHDTQDRVRTFSETPHKILKNETLEKTQFEGAGIVSSEGNSEGMGQITYNHGKTQHERSSST